MIPHCYWVIIEAFLWWTQAHPTAPAGVDLKLCYGSARPVRNGGRAGGWQLSVSERRTRLQEGLRDTEGGCNQRTPWEEEKISEIQTRKNGKE